METSWVEVRSNQAGKNWVRIDANRITRAVRLSVGRMSETKGNVLKVDKHVILHDMDFASRAYGHTVGVYFTRNVLEEAGFDPSIWMHGVGGAA